MKNHTQSGPLRLAVIGAGHLGKIHARLACQHTRAQVVAVADPSPDSRQWVEDELDLSPVEDYRELIGKIDAAVVASTTSSHYDICTKLLQAGIHVLVEKPIAATGRQAEGMLAAAEKNNCVLQVGHVERFNPAYNNALPHIIQPKYIEAIRCGPFTFRSTDVSVIQDLMIHDLDAILALVRRPVISCEAFGVVVVGPHIDMAQARLRFEGGCIADIRASRTSLVPSREMNVYSPLGAAQIDFGTRKSTIIQIGETLKNNRLDVETLSQFEKESLKERFFTDVMPVTEIEPSECNPLLDEQADFLSSIIEGRQPRVTGQDGTNALKTAEIILQSIAEHRWDGHDIHSRIGPKILPTLPLSQPVHVEPAAEEKEQRKAG